MSKPVLTSVLSIAAAALAGAAAAQPVGGVTVRARPSPDTQFQSRAVHFGDINANTPEGARILFRRIRMAAEEVCAPAATDLIKNLPEYEDARDYQACKSDAIRLALADVNSPTLAIYYDEVR